MLEQVSHLFADHPDLLMEFTYFLPDAVQEQAKERLQRAAKESEIRRNNKLNAQSGAGGMMSGMYNQNAMSINRGLPDSTHPSQGKKRKSDFGVYRGQPGGVGGMMMEGGGGGMMNPTQNMNRESLISSGTLGHQNLPNLGPGGAGRGKNTKPQMNPNFLMNPVQGKKKKLAVIAAYRARLAAEGVDINDPSHMYIQNSPVMSGQAAGANMSILGSGLTGLSGYQNDMNAAARQQQIQQAAANNSITQQVNVNITTTSTSSGLAKIPPHLAPTKAQSPYSHMSATLERKFFDQVKEVLTQYSREAWLEFVKCLELFSNNAISKE